MSIPAIGGARGIFEIFVPGGFLLLNLIGMGGLVSSLSDDFDQLSSFWLSNVAVTTLLVIAFSYLLGVVLRLYKCDPVDRWSSAWHCMRARFTPHKKISPHIREAFPYLSYIEDVCDSSLPEYAKEFYRDNWSKAMARPIDGKRFFNFCKTLVNSVDEKSAKEIFAQESLVRYISGMFYALFVCCIWGLFVALFNRVYGGHNVRGLLLLLGAYAVLMVVIVHNFRFIRVKEVETVFAAHLINAKTIQNKIAFGAADSERPSETDA